MTTSILASFPSPPQGVWHLGPLPIRAYALCIILGIIAALMIGDRRWEARGGERGVIYDIALWAVPFGLIGGRLYHLMTDWRTYFGDGGAGPMAALRIWDGGLGIWGAVALGGVGAWIACRKRDIPLPAFGDAIAPGIILAQAIGRIGNYFNQELFGRETTMPWGLEIFFRRDSAGFVDVHSLDGISTGRLAMVVQPTFLYELLWNLLIFGVLLIVDRRFTIGHGRLFALYVAGYCVGRFGIELLRDDTATQIAGIRINSFTSMFVLIGAVVYFLAAPKGREDPATLSGSAAELLEPDSPDDEATASSSSRLADAIAAADAVFDRDAPASARKETPEADAEAVEAGRADGSGVKEKVEPAARASFGSALKTWLAERKAQRKKSPAPRVDARPDEPGYHEQDVDADAVDSDAAETDAFDVWVNDAAKPAEQEDAEPASSAWFGSPTGPRHAERKAAPTKSPAPKDDAVVQAVGSRPTPDDTTSDVAPAPPDEPEDHEQGVQADAVVVDSDAGEAYASGVGANEAVEQTVVHKAEPASGARIGSILKWRPGSRKAEPAKGSPTEDEAVVPSGPEKSNFMTGVAASRLRERAEAEAGLAAKATTAGAEASGRATEAAAVAKVAENTTNVIELAEALKHASNEADAAVARAKRSAETARRAVGEAEAEVAHRMSAVGERVQAAKRDVDVAEAAVAKALESADAARRAVGEAEALVVTRVSEAEAIAEIVQRSIAAGSVADATKRAAEEAGAQAFDQVTEARAAVDRAARVAAEALADVGARETAARKAKRAADHANADAARHVGEARAAVDRAARMAADAEAEISSREAAAAEARRAADDAAVGAAQRMAEEAENKVARLQGKAEAARRAIAEAEAEAARRAEGAAAAAEDARRAADAEAGAAQHATDTKAAAESAREEAHAAEAEIGRFASEARAAAEIAEHAAEAAGAQAAKRVADAVTAFEEAVKAADEAQAEVAKRAAEADALTGIVKQAEAAGPIAQAALRAAQEAEAEARKQVDDAKAAAETANHVADEADADLARHRAAADFARSSGPEAEAAKRAADAHRAASARAADARAAADAAERTASAAGSAVVRSVAEARVAATAANHAAAAETEARQRVAEAHAAAEAAHRKASEAEEDFAKHSAAADAAKRGAAERVF